MVPRKACTFNREEVADDCKECTEICEDEGGVCRTCILQECLTRLGEYEDTGLTPEQIRELKERDTAKMPRYEGDGYSEGEMVYDTWFCPNCEEEYEVDYDDYDFCPNCGQRLLRMMTALSISLQSEEHQNQQP